MSVRMTTDAEPAMNAAIPASSNAAATPTTHSSTRGTTLTGKRRLTGPRSNAVIAMLPAAKETMAVPTEH